MVYSWELEAGYGQVSHTARVGLGGAIPLDSMSRPDAQIDVQAFIIGLQDATLAASHGHRPRLKPWGLQLMKSQYYLKLTMLEILGQLPQWAPK